jgi:phospholipase/lecithinase/hemolysin
MLDQLGTYLAGTGGAADPAALYVVWGGPNDVFLAQALGNDIGTALGYAVGNLVTITGQLLARGATAVLVPGMPDLGLTPAFDGFEALGTQLSQQFNAALLAALMANLPGGWTYFDTAAFLQQVVANPAAYGFANATDACVNPPFFCGAFGDPNEYLFWDTAHPTTAAHAILGGQFAATAVPEPATLLLVGGGVVAAAMARRRARRP